MFEELLLVDPDDEILDTFKTYLERFGYFVSTASNGPESIGRMQLRQPDLLVLEPVLPDDWGERVLENCLCSNERVRLPVIGLSKYSCRAVHFPFQFYFVKPISLSLLLNSIRIALNST